MAAASGTYARTARRPAVGPRVRWDRLGRIAMLLVLVALVYLYVSAGVRVFSTWRHAHHDSAVVSKLAREHENLLRAHNVLSSQAALEAGARKLGLARPGEQPYVVTHLPSN